MEKYIQVNTMEDGAKTYLPFVKKDNGYYGISESSTSNTLIPLWTAHHRERGMYVVTSKNYKKFYDIEEAKTALNEAIIKHKSETIEKTEVIKIT